jgi:hypothetical protein
VWFVIGHAARELNPRKLNTFGKLVPGVDDHDLVIGSKRHLA